MAKYRFKTEQEFKDSNDWSSWSSHPTNWAIRMIKYLGQDVPDEYNRYCDEGRLFTFHDIEGNTTWTIKPSEVVLKQASIGGFELHEVNEILI